MKVARLASARGLAVGLAAGGLGGAALLHPQGLLWGALWPVIVLASCRGYGLVLERATGRRVGLASTMIAGLAVLVTASAVLGRLGALGLEVQLGAIVLGLACCGLAPVVREREAAPAAALAQLAALAAGIAALIALSAVAIARLDLVARDGINHTFLLKRLWDTGALGLVPHQLGAEPAAESYVALAAGPQAAAILEAAVAPMLMVALLFERLRAGSSRAALMVCCLLAAPIVIGPTLSSHWLAATLHAAAFFALGDAITARRIGWRAIACALALAATRHELVLLALPYLAGAILLPLQLPRSRRGERALAAGWAAALLGFQLVLAAPPQDALVSSVLLLAAWPLARGALALLGEERPRSAVAVLCFAVGTWALAVVLDAVRPAQHDEAVSTALWISLAACLAAAPSWSAQGAARAVARLHPEIVAVVLALFVAGAVLAPGFDHARRARVVERVVEAMIAIEYRPATDAGLRGHRDLRALQERLPAGAVIGFWGQSAAALDFRRNPIVDISWPMGRFRDENYLQPIELRSLRGKDYVLVERVEIAPPVPTTYVPWEIQRPTVGVEGALERIACIDLACTYAVRRSPE